MTRSKAPRILTAGCIAMRRVAEAKLSYRGHVTMKSPHGIAMAGECIFGWGKRHGILRKTKHRGIAGDFLHRRLPC
jgi:hypothetical protein